MHKIKQNNVELLDFTLIYGTIINESTKKGERHCQNTIHYHKI